MPDGSGEGQTVKVERNDEGGTKRVWKLATRSQDPSGRAPRPTSSEASREWSPGLHRRPQRASAHRVRPGDRRATDGRHPWSGTGPELDGASTRQLPSGGRRGFAQHGPELDWTRWDMHRPPGNRDVDRPRTERIMVHASSWTRTSVPAPAQAPGVPRGPVISGSVRRPPVVPRHADRSPKNGALPDPTNRHKRQPTRRSSGRGGDEIHGAHRTNGSRPRATGRGVAVRRPHGRPTEPGSGK
jgi:hypothetical protein